MSKSRAQDPQLAYWRELLETLGDVSLRGLFGEHGFFSRGVMFGLVWQGTLFLRVSDKSRAAHEARGLKQFVYTDRNGRTSPMPYFEPPPEAFDDEEEMLRWARPALEAALAAHAQKSQKGGRARSV